MRFSILLPFLAVSVLLLLDISYATTSVITSSAAKDGWASSSSASKTGTFINIGNVNGEVRRGFLYFDTSSIPSGAHITSAVLKIYGANYAGSSCLNVGNIEIRQCSFDPLAKDDFGACASNAKNSKIINLPEGTGVKVRTVDIDPSLIVANGYTQVMLSTQGRCNNGINGNYARICADGTATTGCTADKKPVLEIEYSLSVEIILANVSNTCPTETATLDVLCTSSVPDVNCIGARIGDNECIWDEATGSKWASDGCVEDFVCVPENPQCASIDPEPCPGDMFPLPNYGSDGCVKDYVCAPANTSSCPLALPGECSDGREPKPVYIKNVAVFSKCSSGEKTSSACGTGSREVKCYVQTDKCQQTGSNKTSAIDVQADSAGCSVHTNQSQCQADVSCSWLSFCSGAKSSGLSDQCVPETASNYQCNADSCGAECDGSVGCPSKIVDDTCKYSGTCNQENTCTCSYLDQYCPEAGTTNTETDNSITCYYGVRACEAGGCSLSTCTLNAGETCNASDGCVVNTCSDGVKNSDETDIDCGGSCNKCADNKICLADNDCTSNNCINNVCQPQSVNTPPIVSVSHSPLQPFETNQVTLTATASDADGISAVRIFVDTVQAIQCNSSPCLNSTNYSLGTHNYYAEANDNGVPIATGRTEIKQFTVSSICTPQCSGKSCGDNGCGGTCGTCSANQTCNTNSQCISTSCTPKTCAELGRVCGAVNDNCGGTLSCGTCEAGKVCSSTGQCVQRASPPTVTLKEGESVEVQSSKYSGMTLTVNKITIPTTQETYDTCAIQNVEITLTASSPFLSENHKLFRYPVAPSSVRKASTLVSFERSGIDQAGNKFAIFTVSDNCTNVQGFVCGSNGTAYGGACGAESAGVNYTEGACAGKCYAINNPCAYTNAPTCNFKASIVEVSCSSAQCKIGPCTVCGNNNQACCSGDKCNVDAGLNCVPFGVTGEKRCMKIPACGSNGESCCRGGLDKNFDCDDGLVCHTGKCREGIDIIACKKLQTNCGSENQLCCLPGNTCNSGMVCDVGRCKVSGSGTCGDGVCNVGENIISCPSDCKLLTQNIAGRATDFLTTLFNIFS